MSIRATIDGKPILGSSDVRWEFRAGVKPYETEVDLRPEDAEALLSGPRRPLTLTIHDGRSRTIEIQHVYAITNAVGDNPHVAKVLLVDRRWFWPNTHIERHFNIPRIAGSKRQRVPDAPPELDPLDVKVAYWPGSLLFGDTLWTAEDVLENVLGQLETVENEFNGQGAGFEINPDVGNLINNLPIHDVQLNHAGDEALNAVLKYLPEASVYVNAEGKVVVYSRASGLERRVVEEAGAESVGKGHAQIISNKWIRPAKIHVLFTREHEVRFDFLEQDQETFSEDERYMQNVLPIPDYSLSYEGNTYSQGTWFPFPSALDAWGAPPNFDNLTSAGAWLKFIRRAMVPFFDAWRGIQYAGGFDADADWMARIGAIQSHYRRTFRISPRWMGRIWQLKAVRVATLDPTTGTRSPAVAFADHARMPSQRAYFSTGQGLSQVINVDCGPDSAQAEPPGRAAPAVVSIADHDQGIIHIDFVPDIYRVHEMILPSKVTIEGTDEPGPTGDIEDISRSIAFNALGDTHQPPTLTPNHRVAVILTAIPAGTNSARTQQLHRVTVEPSEVANLLPPSLNSGIADSQGPELEIRINPTIETARVAWVLDRRTDIERSFGVTDGPPSIDDLIVNAEGDEKGGASLKAIAYAVAARTWALLTDRVQGQKTVRLRPETELVGNIDSVSHSIAAQTGAAETEIRLPGRLPTIDLFSLLPDSTRRIVLRLAPSPGKAPV